MEAAVADGVDVLSVGFEGRTSIKDGLFAGAYSAMEKSVFVLRNKGFTCDWAHWRTAGRR